MKEPYDRLNTTKNIPKYVKRNSKMQKFKTNDKFQNIVGQTPKKVRPEHVGPLQNNLEWVTGDKEKANVLNTFFSSVYTKEHGGAHVHNGGGSDKAPNDTQWLKSDMVQKYLDRIKVDKAPGPDGIHPRILKELSSVISKPLYLIFRDSLMTGIVPLDWHRANVVPIFKKETSIVGKILEGLIKDHIDEFLLGKKMYATDSMDS